MEVPDRSKQQEQNRRSYEKHREKRLEERKKRFEDDDERLRKNTFCRSYYWERREDVLAQKAAKWAALTEEEKEDARMYQREYYKKYKEEYKLRGKLDRAKKASEKPELRKVGRPPGPAKIKKSKAPKEYFQYDSTVPLPENNTLLSPRTRYGQKKMNLMCPKGFFQAPESADPFRVSF